MVGAECNYGCGAAPVAPADLYLTPRSHGDAEPEFIRFNSDRRLTVVSFLLSAENKDRKLGGGGQHGGGGVADEDLRRVSFKDELSREEGGRGTPEEAEPSWGRGLGSRTSWLHATWRRRRRSLFLLLHSATMEVITGKFLLKLPPSTFG